MGMAEVLLWEEFITLHSVSPLIRTPFQRFCALPGVSHQGLIKAIFSEPRLYVSHGCWARMCPMDGYKKLMGCLFQHISSSPLPTSSFFSNCTNELNQKPSWNSAERPPCQARGICLSCFWVLYGFFSVLKLQLFSGLVYTNQSSCSSEACREQRQRSRHHFEQELVLCCSKLAKCSFSGSI